MLTYSRTIRVKRPLDEVFEFLVDGRNDVRWRYDVVESELVHGQPLAPGATYRQVMRPGGRELTGSHEVTSIDAPWRFDWRTTDPGPVGFAGHYTFAQAGDATEVTMHVEMVPRGALRLLGPLLRGRLHRVGDRYAADLARVLEGGR